MGKDTTFRIKIGFEKLTFFVLIALLWMVFSPGPGFSQDDDRSIFWGEVYESLEGNGSGENNTVNEMFVKQGLHLFKILDRDFDLYLKGKLILDTKGYYWNNRGEIGGGARMIPFRSLGLVLFVEYLRAMYIDPGHLDSNDPEDSYYYDTQGGYAFWQWWGALPWETEGLNVYLPFSGWREVYSDGIYYSHDDANIIGTLDYKEGLMLAKPGALKFDAYLCLEAGADKNKDEWNNYIAIGPGIGVAPFSKFNLKLSVEYFWGRYTEGGFGDNDEDISKFVFTLAFWHGW